MLVVFLVFIYFWDPEKLLLSEITCTSIPYLGFVSMILNLESAFSGSNDYFQSLICSSSLRNL